MNCIVCGSDKDHLWKKIGEGYYRECLVCGILRLDNPPKQTDFYEATYEVTDEWSRRAYQPRLNRLGTGSLLEVGCGIGNFLNLARERGLDVEGIEPSKTAVEKSKRYNLKIHHGTLEDFKTDKKYDYIAFYHSLEHISDPVKALKIAKSLLKPNGKLIIDLPNPTSPDYWFDRELEKGMASYPHHLYLFKEKVIKRILHNLGFKTETHYHFPFTLSKLCGILKESLRNFGKVFNLR